MLATDTNRTNHRNTGSLIRPLLAKLLQFDRQTLRASRRLKQLHVNLLYPLRLLYLPLPHVGIENVDHLLIAGHFDHQLFDFGAADTVIQPRLGAHDTLIDSHLLLGLNARQRRQTGGPFRARRPANLHFGCRADKREHGRFISGGPGRLFVALGQTGNRFARRNHRLNIHLDPRLGNANQPSIDRSLRSLKSHLILSRRTSDGLGVNEFDEKLRSAWGRFLEQQLVTILGHHDTSWRITQASRKQSRALEPEGNAVPAGAEHFDLERRLHTHHVLFDAGFVRNFGEQRLDRRLVTVRFGHAGAGFFPQLLKLFVRNKNTAAVLLKNPPQL